MNRRGFLAGLILLPAVKYFLPPRGGWPNGRILDPNRYFTSKTAWFLKTEHKDGIALFSRSHSIDSAAFRAALMPGLQKFWAQEYSEHEEDWAILYGANKQLELFSSLDLNSLEEIEIELRPTADAIGPTRSLLEAQRVAIADATRGLEGYGERDGRLLLPRLLGLRKEDTR